MSNISEILSAANTDINTLKQHIGNRYLRNLMEAAYIPEKKFVLPEGLPEFKGNLQHPDQISGAFWQIANKLDTFQRAELPAIRRESIFIQSLESLSAIDAKILIAVKEQTLHKMFKTLTLKNLKAVGYFA
jgi:hypothetical protein